MLQYEITIPQWQHETEKKTNLNSCVRSRISNNKIIEWIYTLIPYIFFSQMVLLLILYLYGASKRTFTPVISYIHSIFSRSFAFLYGNLKQKENCGNKKRKGAVRQWRYVKVEIQYKSLEIRRFDLACKICKLNFFFIS